MYRLECISRCMKYCHASSTTIATANRTTVSRNDAVAADNEGDLTSMPPSCSLPVS
jgi:hypothetical protein